MIDPRAIIDPSASIGEGVSIGPWTIIGPDVVIGDNTRIESHVIIRDRTVIGSNNHIFQFATLGEAPPDLKYKGEPTRLVLGDNNTVREGVTLHRGTVQDRAETTIGNKNLLMAYVHVGHDSVIGDHCIMANNASLAGHVHLGNWANLGGYSLIHQFCHVGEHAFTGMGAGIGKDVPAYVMVTGNPAAAKSINAEGLRRRGFEKETIATIQRAFKTIYRRGLTVAQALDELDQEVAGCEALRPLVDSVRNSTRGITR